MTEDDHQPCGPVGLGSVLYSNSRLAGNTKRVGHAGLGGPGRLEGSGRGPGVPGGTVAGDPGPAPQPSGLQAAPRCSSSPPLQVGVQFRALSCFSFLSLIARGWYLPALTFRFWCPDLETPPPSWPVSTVALTKAKVDPRLPACCVPPPPPVFSLIPAFPSSSHPHPFIGALCLPLPPSEPAQEPAQPVSRLHLWTSLLTGVASSPIPFPRGSPIHFQAKVPGPVTPKGPPPSPSSLLLPRTLLSHPSLPQSGNPSGSPASVVDTQAPLPV